MPIHSQSPASVWQAAYGELELQLPRETFNTWLRDARLIAHEDGTFIIGVQNIYAREWLEHRLKKVIVRALERITKRVVEVRFVLAPEKDETEVQTAGPLLADIPSKHTPSLPFEQLSPGETGLNPQHTFDNFAVGACNRLAHAAATAIVETPAVQFNPFYVHGDTGLGKTHLLHAIGHACVEQGMRVLYVSAETFTNDLVASIRKRSTVDFRRKYREVDVLLLDDIQFLGGKEASQEEFYHTFNALYNASGQIVAASNNPPDTITGLDARLRSRLKGGLVVELQKPDYLTRLDILEIKARLRGFEGNLSLTILEEIADHMTGSVRELEGALNRVLATTLLTHEAPTLEATEAALKDLLEEALPAQDNSAPSLHMEDIIMSVAEYYEVSPDDLIGRGRSREVSTARQVAMYIAREEVDIALQEIGEKLGGRNHSTVLYSCERIADFMTTDSIVRRQVQAILRTLLSQNTPEQLD